MDINILQNKYIRCDNMQRAQSTLRNLLLNIFKLNLKDLFYIYKSNYLRKIWMQNYIIK